MNTFHGQRTCTLNMTEQIPDDYYNITHNTIAAMLEQEDYLEEITTIQISTCHRFVSIWFTNREILETFCQNEHLLLSNTYTKFEPDYQTKIRISIENIPIELPDREIKKFLSQYTIVVGKTYYPGIRHKNKYYTTGTRLYQCVKIKEHIPRHLYKFGRYLQIRYDSQPINSSNTRYIITKHTQDTPIPIDHETPTLSQPQPNVTTRHETKLQQNNNQKSTDKKQQLNKIHATPQNIKQSSLLQ